MYYEILSYCSALKKDLAPLQKKEALRKVQQLQKLLWVLPKKERVGIVDFINEEKEHGAFYLGNRIYEQITDTVKCVSDIKHFNPKTTYVSGEKTIYTPYSGIEKNKDKNFDFQFKIFNGLQALLSLNKDEQKEQLNRIIQTPIVYRIRNLVMHTVLKTSRFIQLKQEKLNDYLLEKRILASAKEFHKTNQFEKSVHQVKSDRLLDNDKQKDSALFLKEPLTQTPNLSMPKKIITNKQNNINRNDQSRIHE